MSGDRTPGGLDLSEARELVGSVGHWYHVLELGPGLVTPGWFDLRDAVERMPWPDVRGKRCLDVGPYDGFLSFELERRGATEVVAADIGDVGDLDWSYRLREAGPRRMRAHQTTALGAGFEVARRCLGSTVERREINVYDLRHDVVGGFDVVVCGSLLLHLKNPIGALEAIRDVCEGHFLSAEAIDPVLSVLQHRRPTALQRGGERYQWWLPNVTGHHAMVMAAGFEVERRVRPYAIPLGEAHRDAGRKALRRLPARLASRLLTRGEAGVPHSAILTRPVEPLASI